MRHVSPQDQIAASHGECNDVKGHTDGLRQVKRQANCTSNVQSKRPGNHVISTSTLNLLVGGNLRHSQGRGHRHQMAHKDNQQCGHQADVGHSVAKTQKQNGTENGRDGRQKHRPRAHGFEIRLRHHEGKLRPSTDGWRDARRRLFTDRCPRNDRVHREVVADEHVLLDDLVHAGPLCLEAFHVDGIDFGSS